MKKKIELLLYDAWLDLQYAQQFYTDALHDLEIEAKGMRKNIRKVKRLLAKASKSYESIYGHAPITNSLILK